jgi:hypothetical protein
MKHILEQCVQRGYWDSNHSEAKDLTSLMLSRTGNLCKTADLTSVPYWDIITVGF